MSTPVNHFHANAATAAALSASLSPERLATYLREAQGDMDRALALHVRNAALGAAFFGPLQALEVALRNAMHRELSALHEAFPNARLNRKVAHGTLDELRRLRNRIAHHEPIFQRNLFSDWTAIETALGWICPVTRDWVVHHSRVAALLQHPANAPIAH